MSNFVSLIFYSCMFLISIFFIGFYHKRDFNSKIINRVKNIFIMFSVIFLPVFISGIRYNVGTDYMNYLKHYYEFGNASFSDIFKEGIEPFAYILHPLSKLLVGAPWGYFLLSSLIMLFTIVKGIIYYKDKISVRFALFIYFMIFWSFSLNGIRQTMAIAIVFYAYRYIIERHFLKYLMTILIATGFHLSGIVCIFFYFLYMESNAISKVKTYFVYSSIIASPLIVSLLLQILLKINFLSKYAERYSLSLNNSGIGFLLWILPIAIPVFIYRKNLSNHYGINVMGLMNIFLIDIPLKYVGYYVSLGSRVSLYCQITHVVIVPLLINSVKTKYERMIWYIYFSIYYLLYFFIQSYIWNFSEAFPYIHILNN